MAQSPSSSSPSVSLGGIYDIVGNVIPGLVALILTGFALPVGSLSGVSIAFVQQPGLRGFIPGIIFIVITYLAGQIAYTFTRFVPLEGSISSLFDAVPITPSPYAISLELDDRSNWQYHWACTLLFLDVDDPATQNYSGQDLLRSRVWRDESLAETYLLQKGVGRIRSYNNLKSAFWTLESLFVLYFLFFTSILLSRFIYSLKGSQIRLWFITADFYTTIILIAVCCYLLAYIFSWISGKLGFKMGRASLGLGVVFLALFLFVFFISISEDILRPFLMYESYIESISGDEFHLLPLGLLILGYIFHFHRQRYLLKHQLAIRRNLYPVAVSEGDIDRLDPMWNRKQN